MIIFLSGPYGVGKSTVADALKEKLNALVFDAEAVGNAVRDNYPDWWSGAVFEDYPLWAEFCVALLKDMHSRYDRTILVPMTLMRPSSRLNLVDRLSIEGIPTHLIVLTAEHRTVHDRILQRGEDEDCWCMQQIDEAHAATAKLADTLISTDNRTIGEVADEILVRLGTEHPASWFSE